MKFETDNTKAMIEQIKVEGNLNAIADKLDELQAKAWRYGIETIRAAARALRLGYVEAAITELQVDGDKFAQYPELTEYVWSVFGCRLHARRDCRDHFCRRSTSMRHELIDLHQARAHGIPNGE